MLHKKCYLCISKNMPSLLRRRHIIVTEFAFQFHIVLAKILLWQRGTSLHCYHFFAAETERTLLTLYILESFQIFYSEEWLRQFTDEEF